MRTLDLIGMILMIIGVNILLAAGLLFINTPIYLLEFSNFIKFGLIALSISGVTIFIVGIIIRIYDSITKDKVNAKTLVLVDNLIDYLKINKGKAFTLNALFQRVDKVSQLRTKRKDVEKLFYKMLGVNEIRVELKNRQKFFMYTGKSLS